MFNIINSLTMVILFDPYFEKYFYNYLGKKGTLGKTHTHIHKQTSKL